MPGHPVPTELLLIDWAGHAFTYELASGLAENGTSIEYAYCGTVVMPHGDLRTTDALRSHRVGDGWVFDRYHPARRVVSEVRFGLSAAGLVWSRRPRRVVTANMPVLSLCLISAAARLRRSVMVVWLQDAQGALAGTASGRAWLGRTLGRIEGLALRTAERVVAISEDLAETAVAAGTSPHRVAVLENWSPIDQIPERPVDNPWSRRHGLADRVCFLYSGTLGRKHDPEMLIELARSFADDPSVAVVVTSEGEGADRLREVKDADGLDGLVLLPYQQFADLPDVLGTATVTLSLLDADAGRCSVPSKILSYLCAGRPVVAAMPLDNLASETVRRAGAGIVVGPTDCVGFVAAAHRLRDDAAEATAMGRAARAYAETTFEPSVVRTRFLTAVGLTPDGEVRPSDPDGFRSAPDRNPGP